MSSLPLKTVLYLIKSQESVGGGWELYFGSLIGSLRYVLFEMSNMPAGALILCQIYFSARINFVETGGEECTEKLFKVSVYLGAIQMLATYTACTSSDSFSFYHK
jgi:hypothetical protein